MGQYKKNRYVRKIDNFAHYQDSAHTMLLGGGVHVYGIVSHKPANPTNPFWNRVTTWPNWTWKMRIYQLQFILNPRNTCASFGKARPTSSGPSSPNEYRPVGVHSVIKTSSRLLKKTRYQSSAMPRWYAYHWIIQELMKYMISNPDLPSLVNVD